MRLLSAMPPVLTLVACAHVRDEARPTVPTAATAAASTRFDEILRWAPEGLESLLLYDPTCPLPARLHAALATYGSTWSVASDLRRMALMAGRFRPHGIGYGSWDGVFVYEFAEDPVPEREALLDAGSWRVETVGGRTAYRSLVTHQPLAGRDVPEERWRCFVGPRILLEASRRHLLEQALRGDHAGGVARAAAHGHATDVDWTAPLILLRSFDANNTADACSPLRPGYTSPTFAITSCCLCVPRAEPMRFRLDVRSGDPDVALDGLARRLTAHDSAPALERLSATRACVAPRDEMFPLLIDLLFGFNILI